MSISEQAIEALVKLEESLWISDTRFDRVYMEGVLHPEFVEFGCSGKIYSRDDTLTIPSQAIHAKLMNIKVLRLADNVCQITYVSEVQYETVQLCNRSSIWVNTDDRWQIIFHQGTPIPQSG